MNRFQRYMFGQVAVSVLLAVGLFVFVLTTGVLFKEVFPYLSRGAIGWGQFFEVLALLIPGALPHALPMGVLTGVLIVLGRMSAQNEILAMRAAGLSLWRIVSPIFLVAAIGVVVSVLINFEHAPRANNTYKRILTETAFTDPSRLIAPGEFARFKNHVIYAGGRTGDLIHNVWVWEFNENGQAVRIMQAETATLSIANTTGGDANDTFQLIIHNAMTEEFNRKAPEDFSEPLRTVKADRLPISDTFENLWGRAGERGKEKKLRHHTFGELMAARNAVLDVKAADGTDATALFTKRIAYQLQIQSNLASALGILSMTMLAIPLGIKTSRSETLVNIAIALALALSFYVLTVLVSWIKDPSLRPDILVWLPNFFYQGVGGWLLWRATRT
ncbi:MAG: LptF/LptG family permease [Puniceicoccales bacterium]|jgi:lipopolysaccharide export system permease protein|nr:LptF/LptG family permease [Puniceicoccales bacterium]